MISQEQSDRIVEALNASTATGAALRQEAMELLAVIPGYDWSGVYRLERDGLHLDEFVGAETDHTFIPVGRGVCGLAVAENRNQIVKDVRQLDNYLACSSATRSEIVVLFRSEQGHIMGQIDIDGHEIATFDETDETFLGRVSDILANRWE
jgi:L-methionine (R)-S-oxide reductase